MLQRMSAAAKIRRLRMVGMAEGASFLLLLGVAMPLKYLAGIALAVKIVGWIHGVLFMLLLYALGQAKDAADWPLGRAAMVLAAALLPFGPFVIDRRLKAEEQDAELLHRARRRRYRRIQAFLR
jgi:integral membrane protein